jgi:hypothetical protein
VKAWDTNRFIALLAERSPKLITDVQRSSFLSEVEFARRVAEGTARDGSSTAILFVDRLEIGAGADQRHVLKIGAHPAETLVPVLASRLSHGHALEVRGPGVSVTFEPADDNAVTVEGQEARIRATPAAASELARALRPERGRRELRELPRLVVEIVPTEIKDQTGRVLRIVG